MIRRYSDLHTIDGLFDRFRYLKLDGIVGNETFGNERYLNQLFYQSSEWKQVRSLVITRDSGCDLAVSGHEISGSIYIHHMNPMTPDDIVSGNPAILDPEFLISVSHTTHNAIHYGDENQLLSGPLVRFPGDTKLW